MQKLTMAALFKKLIDLSIGIFLMAVAFVSCVDKMSNCGVSDEIWTGLEETEKLTSHNQSDQTPILVENLFSKHPPKSLEELSLKYEYLLKHYYYFGPPEKLYQYMDSLDMVSSMDDSDCYRGRATLLFMKAYLEDQSGGSLLNIVQLHEEGKNYNDRFKDECRVKLIPFTLPRIYARQQKYDEAIRYLKEEQVQVERCRKSNYHADFANYQALLNSIGVYYERMMLLDSAETYYLKALDFIQNNSDDYLISHNFGKIAEAVVRGNLGGIYTKLGRLDQAELFLIQSIEINKNPGMAPGDALLSKIKLMELYHKSQRKQKAFKLLEQIAGDTLLVQDTEAESRFGKLACTMFKMEGQYREALKWHERYKAAEDEKNNQFDQQRTKDVEEKIAHVNQRFSYEILERKNALKSRTLWGMGLSGFLSILLISLLWSKRRQQKRHFKSLSALHEQVVSKNRELLTSLTDLQMSQEENKKMMKVLAHDLRTPIAAMVNMSDLITTVELSPEEITELIQLQKESGLSLLSMIKDLLSPNVQNNQNRVLVDMKSLIENCIATLKPLASEKKIKIHIKGPQVELMGHREKLWRLMSNLISNAIKFSHDDSEIFITLEKNTSRLQIQIQDSGIGIPEDQIESLFNMPSNSGRPGTQGEKSFGMGLAICKQIVDLHEGKITCRSQVNKGSTFIIELPIV